MRTELVLCVSLAVAGCGDDPAAEGGAGHEADFEQTLAELDALRAQHDIPGMSMAIVLDGKLAFSGGVGERSLATGEPMTGKSLILSSSIATKTTVAALLLDLEEDGKLAIDAPVKDYAGYLDFETDPSLITLHRLLTHRSGLKEYATRASCTAAEAGIEAWAKAGGKITARSAPDVAWMYSATGVVLGAGAIEALEKRPFTEVARERILVPAGMTTATFDAEAAKAGELATGYSQDDTGKRIERTPDAMPWTRCREWQASEGLFASVEDIAHLVESLLSGGGPLEPASLAKLWKKHTTTGWGDSIGYGYQVFVDDYKGVTAVSHGARNSGFIGWSTWVPERGFGVVVVGNYDSSYESMYATTAFRWKVLDRFLKLVGDPPDNTTQPSTWAKYVGKYKAASPIDDVEIAQLPSGELTARRSFDANPRVLKQGFGDHAYSGGDSFSESEFWGTFFPDASGTMRYLNGSGYDGYFVAERVDGP